jgi:hypothetical protein
VIGESKEQQNFVKKYQNTFMHGVIVRTPAADTEEEPILVPPEGWLIADNRFEPDRAPSHVLPRASTTLLEMDLDERVRRAVLEFVGQTQRDF